MIPFVVFGIVSILAGIGILAFRDAFTEWNARNFDKGMGPQAGNAVRAKGPRLYVPVGVGVIVMGVLALLAALSKI